MRMENIGFKDAVKMLGREPLPRPPPQPSPEIEWSKATLSRSRLSCAR
jgi:hypothetical protein